MDIIWDEEKEKWLREHRRISIQEIADKIAQGDYVAEIENPQRKGHTAFLCLYFDYVHVAPTIEDKDGNIIIKTVYPSRKYHKVYGGTK